MNEIDDSDKSLQQIARCHGKSIVDLLIDIQKSKVGQQKFRPFVENLECLSPNRYRSTLLSRRQINAFENPSYVALSYTWDNESEDPSKGLYRVQNRNKTRFDSSGVRNCVFDRTLKYMRRYRLNLLWIDQHCIRQRSCNDPECDHLGCNQKREGLNAMDLIYKYSDHPVALLATCIESPRDLKLLVRILSGDLVSTSRRKPRFQLSETTTLQEATKALLLLEKLTSDRWWTRGWIFQESYRSGTAMRLLIPHSSNLERLKRTYGNTLFNDIHGELCINIVDFSYEATRLCLAFESVETKTPQAQEAICQIIAKAGKYTLLLEKHESMSPAIISDISTRNLERQWDRLAVAANCCQYSMRLDVPDLQKKGHSMSLSMLAMWLLNGEIFCNSISTATPSRMTALEFLTSQSFKGFYAPLNRRSLSFNKCCRFTHIKLTQGGVLTRGHLWKLGRPIHSRDIDQQPSRVDDPTGKLSPHDRKRLTQLANMLRALHYFPLEGQLRRFLKRDARSGSGGSFTETFAGNYMRMMASELVAAIDQGMMLKLACRWEPSKRGSAYRAIFICDNDNEDFEDTSLDVRHSLHRRRPSLVFTASCPKDEGSIDYEVNDIDRHVSLEARLVSSVTEAKRTVPRLKIGRWVLGLCFFERLETTDVLFPWPPGLAAISP